MNVIIIIYNHFYLIFTVNFIIKSLKKIFLLNADLLQEERERDRRKERESVIELGMGQ